MTWLSRFKIGALLLSTMTLAAAARAQPFPTNCSNENQTCSFPGTRDVAFGANNSFVIQAGVVNSISCTTSAFGGVDPAPNVAKACWYASAGPAGYTNCANENQTCTFSGTQDVAYGAAGHCI